MFSFQLQDKPRQQSEASLWYPGRCFHRSFICQLQCRVFHFPPDAASPPLSVTSAHLTANLITSPLPQNLTSFSSFYFEQRIDPTALPPPPLSCSSRLVQLHPSSSSSSRSSESDDLLAVSHLHPDSSSMYLLLSAASLLPLFTSIPCHSSSHLSRLT